MIIHFKGENICKVEFQTKACKLSGQLSNDNSKCHVTIIDSVKAITGTLDITQILKMYKREVVNFFVLRMCRTSKQWCIVLSRLSINDQEQFERSEHGNFEISLGSTRSSCSYILLKWKHTRNYQA